ncbi:MAG TPA: biotin-dependent carboxyltransferase family protein [Pseudonocardiaceae bacterium]|nr:biotin-dependent carboxyltransferase family protein [Pseudonocardiaceae bacterium]
MRTVAILATGPQVLVQDLGRPGFAHLGVPPSGALDGPALRLANRLVGNEESLAGLEILLGGLRLRAESSCVVAVTGPSTSITVDGRQRDTHAPIHLSTGDELTLAQPVDGLRNYLTVNGGIAVEAELGSRSTDVLSGIGPDAVQAGDVLPVGEPQGPPTGADQLAAAATPAELTLPVLLGPREDWFDDPAAQLRDGSWRVSPESNRIGLRLTGPALRRAEEYAGRELPSEPVITGAVQVPANGRPVVFLADHPTTGGYPVLGVVPAADLAALAQVRPGTVVLLRPV